MPAFGDDVVAVAEKLGLGELVLIGHSMGGDVVVEAALRLPGRVLGLVWADTYSTLGESHSPVDVERFVAPFREDFVTATRNFVRPMFGSRSDPNLVERVITDMSASPPDIAIDAMKHAIGNDSAIIDGLRRLKAPVVAINPDHRPTDIEALRRHGVKTMIMSGVGHFGMLEDPDNFNCLLGETIEEFKESQQRRTLPRT
jgi:pimeloyl-ACP methyl ester carboxylesterase